MFICNNQKKREWPVILHIDRYLNDAQANPIRWIEIMDGAGICFDSVP